MSGIAGLLRFDGRTVTRHDLERAANALGQYGPDRSEIIAGGSIGLVHVLMRMTPEDRFDRQPWRGASGALITADLRLDNRDDVLARIGVAPQDAAAWADSRVLLAAWEKLGDDIWPMLRGPFAAAIWDPRSRVLTLARDHLGLNVVMWHKSEQFFAFATMPNGLFALADVPRELSEEKFADFLVLNHADHATTVYRNVFRVLPAHVMQVKADGSMTQRRYWSPAEIKPVRLSSDSDYADGLRECLDAAVRRQMRSAHPIGCLLSGGLEFIVGLRACRPRARREKSATRRLHRRAAAGLRWSGADRPLRRRNALRRSDSERGREYRRHLCPQRCDATISPNSSGSSSRWKGRCAIRPISAGSWRFCGSRARKAGGCCSAAFMAITPSAGTAGRKRSPT